MDEFDKIRELTEDLTNRREPSFTGFYQTKTSESEPKKEELKEEATNSFNPSFSSSDPVFELNSSATAQTEDVALSKEATHELKPSEETEPEIKIYDFSKPIEEEISFIPIETESQIEEKNFPSLKLHLILISVLVVILGISLTGFFIFQASESESDEVETILASPDVVKELPEHAGGIVIPDQDKLVYNRIRSDNVTTKVESLFPEPEKPVVPQILAIEQNAPEATFVNVKEMKTVNPLEEEKKEVKVIEQKKEELVVEPVQVVQQVSPVQQVIVPVVQKEEVLAPKKEVIELAPVEKVTVKKEVKPTQKEIWRVQLFASNNKAAVEKAWKVMKTKHVKLLSNMSYIIKKVEIPRKGDFYRLQVGQFPTREMADGMCSKLKAKKQDCIPVK